LLGGLRYHVYPSAGGGNSPGTVGEIVESAGTLGVPLDAGVSLDAGDGVAVSTRWTASSSPPGEAIT